AGSPSVHFRRISDSCSGVGVHTDFAVIRGVASAAEGAGLSGRANGTTPLNVAQQNARAVKIARVILFLLVISSGYFFWRRAGQGNISPGSHHSNYSEPPPGTKTREAVERYTSFCSVRTRMLRISPFFFLLRGVSNFSKYSLFSTTFSCSRKGPKEIGVCKPWKNASPP